MTCSSLQTNTAPVSVACQMHASCVALACLSSHPQCNKDRENYSASCMLRVVNVRRDGREEQSRRGGHKIHDQRHDTTTLYTRKVSACPLRHRSNAVLKGGNKLREDRNASKTLQCGSRRQLFQRVQLVPFNLHS